MAGFDVVGLVGGMIAYDFVYYVTCCFTGVSGGWLSVVILVIVIFVCCLCLVVLLCYYDTAVVFVGMDAGVCVDCFWLLIVWCC